MAICVLAAVHDRPAAVAAATEQGMHVVRWPEDAPKLIERHWDSVGEALDALCAQTSVPRVAVDEAAALPGIAAFAGMLTLLEEELRPLCFVADPVAATAFVTGAANLDYAGGRLLTMPLDLLGALNRKLRPLAAAGEAITLAGRLLAMLRAGDEWVALVQDHPDRPWAARHLSLAGMRVVSSDTGAGDAFARLAAEADTAEGWLAVEQVDDGYRLAVRAESLTKESLTLARAGDDLIVTVDGVAHRIALPGGLKRCDVTGAGVRGGRLVVNFRPDETRWR